MAKYLVVVESPTKARTINKFLGPNYVVKASMGHVRDLPKSQLGVDIEDNFKPKYVTMRESMKQVKALKDAAAKVKAILLATDPDREGEAIGWHIAQLLEQSDKPVERIVFNEITKRSIQEAATKPRALDMNLVNAQQARRVLDRLVGYKISPLLQCGMRRGLSAGRVQSVAVRMVCDREAEIRAFVAQEYWTLDILFATIRDDVFTARLSRIGGEKAEIASEAAMNTVLKALESAEYSVTNVTRKEVKRRPFPPFITSSMQQEASRKLRFSPRKTDQIAQQLYEGIQLGSEGSVGLITYMRTDSTRLAWEAVNEARAFIQERFGVDMVPEKPNVYPSKKGAQDAHEAIRATSAARTPDSIKEYLTADQLSLYTLIWQRFIACQMAPAVLDQTSVDITAKQHEFRAVGTVMKFPGFTALYEEERDSDEDKEAESRLPQINEGEKVAERDRKPEQHFTKPPPRYNEATLIRALEENGIGRPSTYAQIMNVIIERGYVEREQRRLKPTELGEEVNRFLIEHFPHILDINFTANLEDDLDHVEDGQREWHDLLRDFYARFDQDLTEAQRRLVVELVGEDARCPKCGSQMEAREGRFGPFLGCERYPDCDGRINVRKKSEAEPTDEVCTECGAQMVIRTGRFGRFLACSNYPKCKNTFNVDAHGNKIETPPKEPPKKTDQKCPQCGAFLLIRKSRRGEEFYGCEKYPKCKFTKPMELNLACPKEGCEGQLVSKLARGRRFIGCDQYPKCDYTLSGTPDKDTPCPECSNPWTVVVRARGKDPVRRCPVPSCGHEVTLEEAGAEAD